MGERALTIQEVAEYFEVSRQAVYKWVESGQIRAIRQGKVKRHLRIPMDAIREFAASRGIDVSDLDSDKWATPCAAAA
jgi:excisionase family DNA binding protein